MRLAKIGIKSTLLKNAPRNPPTARDYVSDGLVAMWDGIENAGFGNHDPNAIVWKDLIGGIGDISVSNSNYNGTGYSWNTEKSNTKGSLTASTIDNIIAMEIVAMCPNYSSNKTGVSFVMLRNTSSYRKLAAYVRGRSQFEVKGYKVGFSFAPTPNTKYSYSIVFDEPFLSVNGITQTKTSKNAVWGKDSSNDVVFGGYASSTLFSVRFYSRKLSSLEISKNYAIDKIRFGL
jgi:hypothetical protein